MAYDLSAPKWPKTSCVRWNKSSLIVPVLGISSWSLMYHRPFDVETLVVDSDDLMSFLQNSSERYPTWIVCKTEGSVVIDSTALMDRVGFVYVAVSNVSPGKVPSGT